jgi:hypothetical protein
VLGALSMVFFLIFLGGLRSRLRSAEPPPRPWATVVLGAGVAFAVLFAALSTMRGATAFALDNSHAFRAAPLDPQLVRLFEQSRGLFYLHALIAGAILIGSTSVIVLRTRLLPAAFGWGGLVIAAIVLVVSFLSTAVVFLLLLWILAASAVLGLQLRETQPPAPAR